MGGTRTHQRPFSARRHPLHQRLLGSGHWFGSGKPLAARDCRCGADVERRTLERGGCRTEGQPRSTTRLWPQVRLPAAERRGSVIDNVVPRKACHLWCPTSVVWTLRTPHTLHLLVKRTVQASSSAWWVTLPWRLETVHESCTGTWAARRNAGPNQEMAADAGLGLLAVWIRLFVVRAPCVALSVLSSVDPTLSTVKRIKRLRANGVGTPQPKAFTWSLTRDPGASWPWRWTWEPRTPAEPLGRKLAGMAAG